MTATTVPSPGYGALELKRSYQHNLLTGILIASFVHLAALGSVIAVQMLQVAGPTTTTTTNLPPVVISVFDPPPSLTREPKLVRTDPTVAPPTVGIPIPYPDEEVVEEVHFATKHDILEMSVADLPGGETGFSGVFDSIVIDQSGLFPEPGQFVAFQEPPLLVHAVPAVYPEIAQLTGREGSVTVYALVGKDGTVLKTAIAKPSGSKLGFDEAAIEAVSQYRFRPALQNGNPVVVWVSQRIEFELD